MPQGKRVLIIEDDRDLRTAMVEVLKLDGYQAYQAEHGQAALDLLQQLPSEQLPDCIILDYMMPVMDAPAFVESVVRDNPQWAKINMILVTAKGHVGNEVPKVPLVREVIRKPMDIDELLAAVARQVRE